MSIGKAVVVAAIILTSVERRATACSCVDRDFVASKALESYSVVFVGNVVRIELVEHCGDAADKQPDPWASCWSELEATFRISKSWRGVADGYAVVRTGMDDGDCGVPFSVGQGYLVFAGVGEDRRWSASLCSPTTLAHGHEERIRALGDPVRCFTHRPGEKW